MPLVVAAQFWQFILALHIFAVVVAFGVTFAYPLIFIAGERLDRSAMPWFHRVQQQIGRKLINPGLTVVLLAGIYLAAHLHQWKYFYLQWGIGVVIVLGALEGSFMIPREGKLVGGVGTLMQLLVVLTVVFMTLQTGV
jgi:hypothetical protein